jgi:tetratricopeptide (TPR) repeat protein
MAVEVVASEAEGVDASTAHAKFPTGGLARADGSDFRVIGPDGNLTPHYLLHTSPETYSELFFKASAGAGTYWAYFGNPKAEPPPPGFGPKCGLAVSFHRLGKFPTHNMMAEDLWKRTGRIEDYEDFEAFLRTRGPKLSALSLPKIEFDRADLLPSETSLLLFHGWLHVPADGVYTFCIASEDASALVLRSPEFAPKAKDPTQLGIAHLELDIGEEDIEETIKKDVVKGKRESAQKTVLYFPGGRGESTIKAIARAYHVGRVELKKGTKELFYYQTTWRGLQFAALAWIRPEVRRWEILGAAACVRPLTARILSLESKDNSYASFFDYREVNAYYVDRFMYMEAQFEVIAPRKDLLYEWDFGDGVDHVRGEKATHVYVLGGKLPVTLSALKDGKEVSRFTVKADILGRKETENDFAKTIARYGEVMRDYPFSKLPEAYFHACMTLYEKLHSDPSALASVLQSYVDTYTPKIEPGPNPGQFLYYQMPQRQRIGSQAYQGLRDNIVGFYMRLAQEQQGNPAGSPEAAIRTYQRVRDLYPEQYPAEWFDRRARALWEIGQIHLHREEFEKASEAFTELEKEAGEGFEQWRYHGGAGLAADQYRSWIRSGILGRADIALRQAQLDRMKELCEQASKVERTALAPAVASAKRASHRTTVEDQLRRGWPEDALASIRGWEVAFPKDKADGFTEFLRGKALFGLRRFDDARKHLRLCRLLIPPDDPALAETHFLDADALFWSGSRKEADAAFQQFLRNYPQSPFAKTAERRLKTIEVLRMDLVDGPEPYLVEHQPYVLYGTVYSTVGYVPGWGGRCREVSRWSVLTYEFPVPKDVDRIVLRFHKKGVMLLHVNDKQFWQEPHTMADEDMIDQELLFTDRSFWADGKLKLTFRDGLNYGPHMDPVVLFIDWIELHLLRPE